MTRVCFITRLREYVGCEGAVGDLKAVGMPERILALEDTLLGLDVGCTFQSRFAGVEGAIDQKHIFYGEKRALAAKLSVIYCFNIHCCR